MAWTNLPTDYTDATYEGSRKFTQTTNSDGTISFTDVTTYTNKEKSFFGASDANSMNEALNYIMNALENNTDLYEDFKTYFENQQAAFTEKGNNLINSTTSNLQTSFDEWFANVKSTLSGDTAGNLQNEIDTINGKMTTISQTVKNLGQPEFNYTDVDYGNVALSTIFEQIRSNLDNYPALCKIYLFRNDSSIIGSNPMGLLYYPNHYDDCFVWLINPSKGIVATLTGRNDGNGNVTWEDLTPLIAENTGAHNSIYRGKYLGSSISDETLAEISNGTFNDLYIGDYFTIGEINYRIAAFDYFPSDQHHVVIVPDSTIGTSSYNPTTTNGYATSYIQDTAIRNYVTILNQTIGSNHIMEMALPLSNTYDTGVATHSFLDESCVILRAAMLFGHDISDTDESWKTRTLSQLPLFHFNPKLIYISESYWLQDIYSNQYAFAVGNNKLTESRSTNVLGVRPVFCVC